MTDPIHRTKRWRAGLVMACALAGVLCLASPAPADGEATEPAAANHPDEPGDAEARPCDRGDRMDRRPPRPLERLRRWRESQADPNRPDTRPFAPEPAGRMPPLNDEQVHQMLAVLGDVNPDLQAKLRRALRTNPERARHVMARMHERLRPLIELRADEPEHYRLRVRDMRYKVEAFKLAMQVRRAAPEDPERAQALRGELHDMIDKHFEVRQALRERELHQLERRINELREELAEHRSRKAELVEQHMARLLQGHRDPPDGDDPHHRPHHAPDGVHATPERDDPRRDRPEDR